MENRPLLRALPPKRRESSSNLSGSQRKRKQAIGLSKRGHDIGDLDSTIGWDPINTTADGALYHNMDRIRARCRDIATNNEYGRHATRLIVNNVAGPKGVKFQARCKFNGGNRAGERDKAFNKALEALYIQASKKKHKPTACGRHSMRSALRLIVFNWVVDGEVFLMFEPGTIKNKFGFNFKFIDPARIDWTVNQINSETGNRIKMGIEVDEDDMPIAYYVLEEDPREISVSLKPRHKHRRISAEFMVHLFVQEAATQTRGVSLLASGGLRAHLINAFERATVIGATIAASKMGFYKVNQEAAEDYGVLGGEVDGEFTEDVNDDAGITQEATPGMFEQLPSYVDGVETFDPNYPPANFEEFEKRMIRGMASAFGVQYHQLSNDLEGVNFTSSRTGEISQRDVWNVFQDELIEGFCERHFEAWSVMVMLNNEIKLDKTKLSKLVDNECYTFLGRGWSWVDPAKQMTANKMALELGLTSRRRILAEESGEDIEDVIDELEEEENLMRSKGIEPRLLQKKEEKSNTKKPEEDEE